MPTYTELNIAAQDNVDCTLNDSTYEAEIAAAQAELAAYETEILSRADWRAGYWRYLSGIQTDQI